MTTPYEQFLDKILQADIFPTGAPGEERLELRWVTGGISGGSYRDTENYPVDPDPEPAWTELDRTLDACAPRLMYSQYRELSKIITQTPEEEPGYYGNYTNYMVKQLRLRDLFDFLTEKGLL